MIAPEVKANNQRQLHDTQATPDDRGLRIDKVGIKGVKFPIRLQMKDGSVQHSIGTFSMYVELPHEERGTHMSRFMECLQESKLAISPDSLTELCEDVRLKLKAPAAFIELDCTVFIEKPAPVTGVGGMVDYKLKMSATTGHTKQTKLGVRVPAKSLCPCSKAISDYGAHNQRSEIEIHCQFDGEIWLEDLISHAEHSASSPIYSLLKRPDERHITQAAFDNPKFVEDIVRDLALALDGDARILDYTVSAENFESIHNHQAYAEISRVK